jgi:hypothetical protein
VRGKVTAKFTDLGEQSLKNIARPLRVYRIGPAAAPKRRSGVGFGGVSDAAPHAGLAGTPRPGAILPTSSVNKVSVARRTARSLAYPPAEAKAGSRRRGTSGRPRRPLPIIWWTGASCRAT